MFYRIFGTSGHGKTQYILNALKNCVSGKKKAFLIVPEQCALEAEKLILKELSGKSNLYVEVINFKRLCNRVFRALGGLTAEHLDDGAKKLLMLMTLDKISPFLKEYKNGADISDFCDKAERTFNRLLACRITPSMLEKAADEISSFSQGADCAAKLRDIALICEAYGASLSQASSGNADMYDRLCQKLKKEPFFEGCDVFFDGFYGFTEQEYNIISLISEQADNTFITFSSKKGEKDAMFKRSTDAAKKSLAIAERSGCEICDIELSENFRHKTALSLKEFQQSFRTSNLGAFTQGKTNDGSLITVMCSDIHDEARYVCSRIHSLIRQGARYKDIVICARNLASYVGILDTALLKAQIPAGFDIPYPFSKSALYELVLSALEGASDFKSEDCIRYIKTGLSGLDEEEADTLETYMRTWNISPKLFKQDEDFTMNPDGYVDSLPDEYTLCVVNSGRKKLFTCLDSLNYNLSKCETVKDYCSAVYSLIQDITRISGAEEFDDCANGEALELLCNMLDSFVSFGKDEKISKARFITAIKSCGKSYEYAHIPSKSDEVRVSDVTLMRASNTKHVILLGANSGIFPAKVSDTGLISENERKMLESAGITIDSSAEEAVYDELFLAYSAICSPSLTSDIVFSAKTPGGEDLYPSVIVTSAEKITGRKREIFNKEDCSLCFAGNKHLFDELLVLPKGKKRNTLIKYFSSLPQFSSKLNALINTFSQSDRLEAQTLRMIYGNTLITSYSRLEKFRGCPFAHFCAYTLKLRSEPVASLGPSEAGSVMHAVLEHLVPLLCKADDNGVFPDETQAKELVKQLLSAHLLNITHTGGENLPKRFVYLYGRLSRLLETLACNIVRELKVTKFIPADFELNISSGGDISPVPIDMGNGCTLYIVGQIDRVDVYEKDDVRYVRIIDYKTGKKTFKMKDIQKGFNLQMLLYLEAIRQRGKERYGGDILPAGVLYSNVASSVQSISLSGDLEKAAALSASPISSGVFLDDEGVLLAMDSSDDKIFLPVTEKNCSETLLSLEEMGNLLDFASETAASLAKEIHSGLKSVTPFEGKGQGVDIDPCSYCEMRSICAKE